MLRALVYDIIGECTLPEDGIPTGDSLPPHVASFVRRLLIASACSGMLDEADATYVSLVVDHLQHQTLRGRIFLASLIIELNRRHCHIYGHKSARDRLREFLQFGLPETA